MNEVEALKAQVAELTEELAVVNKLLDERNRVMDAIPPCPEHGPQCVPHAMQWVSTMKAREENEKTRRSFSGKNIRRVYPD